MFGIPTWLLVVIILGTFILLLIPSPTDRSLKKRVENYDEFLKNWRKNAEKLKAARDEEDRKNIENEIDKSWLDNETPKK